MHTSQDTENAHIETFTGKLFHILDPRQDEICIEDIAHALARICRFTGHTKKFYSVAEHCIHAAQLVRPSLALEALMHDSSEAYIGDMSRPLKHFTEAGKEYIKIEEKIEKAIARKFGLAFPMSPEIKKADNLMLYAEKAQLTSGQAWKVKWAASTDAADVKLQGYIPEIAEGLFLCHFKIYSQERSRVRVA